MADRVEARPREQGARLADEVTDEGVERPAGSAARLAELAARPEVLDAARAVLPMVPHLARFAQRMRPLVEAGGLDRLADVLGLGMAVYDGVTPEQMERLAYQAEQLLSLANRVMVQDPARLWVTGMAVAAEAWEKAEAEAPRTGLIALARALQGDPDMRRLSAFVLALARGLSQRFDGTAAKP